jgi:2-polyprenyl-6-hydroxyphenyl methylase/3-demethylubiquinone-9 3-methyltransferase
MERKAKSINNAFYDDLRSEWHEGEDNPLVLLRAENALRNPWIDTIVQERLKKKCSVLDIGCGGGLLTNFLSLQGYAVCGVDLSEESLEQAQERDVTKNVIYTQASAYSLPYAKQQFDVVCAMDLLEHVERPDKVIEEAGRVLKKGGLFFFHTFNRNFLSWLMIIKGVEWFVPNTPPNMHVYPLFLKPLEVKKMCLSHGMKVEEIKGVSPEMKSLAFWKMIFMRKLSSKIRFTFTPSLKTGYSGYAIKE